VGFLVFEEERGGFWNRGNAFVCMAFREPKGGAHGCMALEIGYGKMIWVHFWKARVLGTIARILNVI
jgi:hypothetical protein